jgi:hypothetical protein
MELCSCGFYNWSSIELPDENETFATNVEKLLWKYQNQMNFIIHVKWIIIYVNEFTAQFIDVLFLLFTANINYNLSKVNNNIQNEFYYKIINININLFNINNKINFDIHLWTA